MDGSNAFDARDAFHAVDALGAFHAMDAMDAMDACPCPKTRVGSKPTWTTMESAFQGVTATRTMMTCTCHRPWILTISIQVTRR